MPLAWSGLAAGSEARDPGDAAGPGAGSRPVAGSEVPDLADGAGPSPWSGVVPGCSAAPLQAPSVVTSLIVCDVLLTNAATIPRRVRGTSPQSLGLPGCNALDKSRTNSTHYVAVKMLSTRLTDTGAVINSEASQQHMTSEPCCRAHIGCSSFVT